MNHFVALSKCLPGLVGIIEPDEDKPEHQLVLDMRHRIIASMNKLLDDMKLPSKQGDSSATTSVSVQEASALVSEMIKIFTRETEQLRGVVLPQASTKRVAEIKTAIDTFAQQVKEQFEAAYFQKFTGKNMQTHEKSVQDSQKIVDARAAAEFINGGVEICTDVCIAELRKLRDGLLMCFPSAEHGQIIRAAVSDTVNRIGCELHAKFVGKTVEIK